MTKKSILFPVIKGHDAGNNTESHESDIKYMSKNSFTLY